MKLTQILLIVALSAGTAFAVGKATSPVSTQADAKKETAFERVMRTGTLRCGYIPYSYLFRVDPNTHQKSGVLYDVVEELGRLSHLKIEWTEELNWGTYITAIETSRVDALCSGAWIDTPTSMHVGYSAPLYYNAISAYGRANETRFHSLADLNDPTVQLVARDGSTSQVLASQDFPKATQVGVAAGVSDGELIETVATGKADAIIYGDDLLLDYMQKNPGKMKALFPEQKVRIYPLAIALPMNDEPFKSFIDNALYELRGSKFIQKALGRNAPQGGWVDDPAVPKG